MIRKKSQKAETTQAKTKPKDEKLSREQWEENRKKKPYTQNETSFQDNKTAQTNLTGFQPARSKPQQFQNQNNDGFQTRGGRGRGRGGRYAGREGEGQDQYQQQGGRGGRGGRYGNRNNFPNNEQEGEGQDQYQQQGGRGPRRGRGGRYGNRNFPKIEQEAQPEWDSAAPTEQPVDTIGGWGDNTTTTETTTTTTTDTNAEWDTINQETSQNVPTKTQGFFEKEKAPVKTYSEPKTKTLDDYLNEQKVKQQQLVDLLGKNSITAPVPRTIEKDQSGRYIDAPKQTKKKR